MEQLIGSMAACGVLAGLILLIYAAVKIKHDTWLVNDGKLFNLFLIVKNTESQVEGVIRWILAWRQIKGINLNLLILEYDSQDETPKILNKFNYPYQPLTLFMPKNDGELKKVKENLLAWDIVELNVGLQFDFQELQSVLKNIERRKAA